MEGLCEGMVLARGRVEGVEGHQYLAGLVYHAHGLGLCA